MAQKKTNSSSKENPNPPQPRDKASKKSSRSARLQDRNTGSVSSGAQDDAARIHELEALLRETQGQLRTTEARLEARGDAEQGSSIRRNATQDHRIGAPSRLSDVTMKEIRTHLGYDRKRWSALRACVRDCLRAARLNWDSNWKSQSTTKLGYAFNAIEDDFPELRRFNGQWAVNRIAKDVWDNHKTYMHCVDQPSTYIGRRAAQRRARGGAAGTNSPRHSPTPGPSQPHPQPRRRLRAPSSSSSDDDDDLLNFNDDQYHDSVGEEEEDGKGGKGKKRAKGSGCLTPPVTIPFNLRYYAKTKTVTEETVLANSDAPGSLCKAV
ncbi:hypothetical protein K438DRAFT_1790832 [Mycena galopus ATCC 62051]|nr:hypothetical protein K438DRAFT_1790832 [Mycena galopus ATCC 62051]